jgi:hypothetical protein
LWPIAAITQSADCAAFDTLADITIPGGSDIVRNMDVTRDGNPVFAESLTNQVGLVEVAQEHAASTQH